jgi:flagellar biosynthetic protein FlhB
MAEQEQNRSEPATPYKLEEAKKQGQVAKSLDFNSFAIVSALLLVLIGGGQMATERMAGLAAWLFELSGSLRLGQPADTAAWLAEILMAALGVVVPIAAVGVIFAVLSNLLQTGPVFTFEPLKPKFERINPVAGLKRVFNKRMLFEGLKTILKLGVLSLIVYAFLVASLPGLPAVAVGDVGVQMDWLARNGIALLFRLALALLVFGIIDLAWTRWQYGKQMMMSRRELKEEIKRREGDPLIRAKMRELQKENLKQASSLGRVPDADVIITNPQHLAVALQYVRGEMAAPHIIAKGMEAWAADMRSLARRHDIPVIERKTLARELFRRGQIDRPVPPQTYIEVARVYVQAETERRATRLRRAAGAEVRQ